MTKNAQIDQQKFQDFVVSFASMGLIQDGMDMAEIVRDDAPNAPSPYTVALYEAYLKALAEQETLDDAMLKAHIMYVKSPQGTSTSLI